jgi:hypothetical protein
MTIEDYQRNLRGVNGGANFSPEYLVGNHPLLDICVLNSHSKTSMTQYANGKL